MSEVLAALIKDCRERSKDFADKPNIMDLCQRCYFSEHWKWILNCHNVCSESIAIFFLTLIGIWDFKDAASLFQCRRFTGWFWRRNSGRGRWGDLVFLLMSKLIQTTFQVMRSRFSRMKGRTRRSRASLRACTPTFWARRRRRGCGSCLSPPTLFLPSTSRLSAWVTSWTHMELWLLQEVSLHFFPSALLLSRLAS